MEKDINIMSWNDVLENDGQEFLILPEGDYTYTVTDYERGQYAGGEKIPPCPKATIYLEIETEQGTATSRVELFLYRKLEKKIAAFFRSIGQKKHGEKISMDWNKVIGSRGRAHFMPFEYVKNGQTRRINSLDYFIDYDPSVAMIPVQEDDVPWSTGG